MDTARQFTSFCEPLTRMPTSLQLTPELARYGEQQVKIGIFSDSHDDIPSLTAAAQAAVAAGAEALLHCGDVVAAVTLARLPEWPVPMWWRR